MVLTRDGAVFTGGVLPRSASCDDIQAGIDVVITTQGESMTLVGTPTGPVTVDCGGGVTQTDEFQPVAFTGTLVDGSPPQTWP
ncbi:MAG: hypothetical protein H0V10_07855 [Geodermatophilaceae bacterium]|nr:hypothetical protein [Geodermatophilaceae bacterium]